MWLLVLCMLVMVFASLIAYGTRRWSKATQSLSRRLDAARMEPTTGQPAPTRYHVHELAGLPVPVQRYFRNVLRDGQPIIAAAGIELDGTLNLSATGARWKSFTSRQRIVIRRPGFLWDARVFMLPGIAVRVYDAYIAGKGLLRAEILGVFAVADLEGHGEIARGELIRFFAEMAWYPTALLPGQGVRWEAIDDRSANATIVDGPLTVTLCFTFNEAGLIESAYADARGAQIGKDLVLLPWEGRWSNYQVCEGMTVPFTGEAAWLRPEGRKPYFHGCISSLTYEFSP